MVCPGRCIDLVNDKNGIPSKFPETVTTFVGVLDLTSESGSDVRGGVNRPLTNVPCKGKDGQGRSRSGKDLEASQLQATVKLLTPPRMIPWTELRAIPLSDARQRHHIAARSSGFTYSLSPGMTL